ncbi:beta-1,4-galactosyltransferase 7-like [Paramacrobiotus metropolitanus]|uniref:beta-1,4-galactosyltransferase 7-like n=1 Tax=Paramacrobiotus metropolitanus TaxID=2943436 RepID=UPI0024462E49|nr:beta-1,4-galactosyltransferase 7-like [Paramacrobiotus metropolitanus]XP_055327174.1 beta-1,4-galactosyltransferase 7-like [Paramacrobiotus metropolitanus]
MAREQQTASLLRFRRIIYHIRRMRTYPIPIVVAVCCTGFLVLFFILTVLLYFLLPLPLPQHHRLAVIVPFRDRFDELLQFVPHMTAFLRAQRIRFDIFVINQVDEYRFNRASLINVGFLYTKDTHDYVVMHDVDLLPDNRDLRYDFPALDTVMHIASPELHPRYHYKKFIGGILIISTSDFQRVKGMSNNYWGWGMEDDEFYVRLNESKIQINRPVGITSGYRTFLHIHDARQRKRDVERLPGQRDAMRKRDREGGVHNVGFLIQNRYDLIINGSSCTIVNVKLHCDLIKTPWCVLPNVTASSKA